MKQYYKIKSGLLIALAAFIFSFLGCKEDIGITVNKIGEKPGPVTNVQSTPISGGAIIKYDLPLSEDLRYVKATYKLDNGIQRETKSSIYKNTITVDGYGIEGEYEVELQTVSVGEVASDPITVKVNALRPPYLLVLDKMNTSGEITSTFGGLNLNYINETKANLVIRIIKKDSTGKWVPVESEYTNFEAGTIKLRGQDAVATDFGIYIEDRWDHTSDTLMVNLTPIEEVLIPRNNWAWSYLPGDAGNRGGGFDVGGIWDGNTNRGYLSTNAGGTSTTLPNSITFDLGTPALISRMQIWATRYSNISDVYGPAHIYDFEIYGSNSPSSTGAWDNSWTLLGHFTSSRPTGFGFGVPATTAERDNIRDNGETYEFPDPTGFPKFRYIRFKNYATWNGSYEGGPNFFIYEMYLFGQL
ncbi:MAG: DUF4959 domain-containing protein [Niabella sp.]